MSRRSNVLPPLRDRLWRAAGQLGSWPLTVRQGPAQGMKLLAPLTRRRGYGLGRHELHVLGTLSRRVQPGMVVLDVGAHLGYFTLALARRVGDSGRVFAFEPHPRHGEVLRRTVQRNHLSQVEVVAQAVTREVGTGWLAEPLNDAMARLVEAPAPRQCWPVPLTTLDAWAEAARPSRVDLIKLDIEGEEAAALAGARQLLERFRPQLVIEVHWSRHLRQGPEALMGLLKDAGYTFTPLPAGPDSLQDLPSLRYTLAVEPAPEGLAAFHLLAEPL